MRQVAVWLGTPIARIGASEAAIRRRICKPKPRYGSKNRSQFASQLSFRLSRNPSRVMWPVAERNLEEVEKELELSLKEVEQLIERLLR